MSDLSSRLGPPLALSHCLEDQFLDRFRADIAGAEQEVIVLSPFLSKNRASQYYAAFAATAGRAVGVTVYARPKWEQPGMLVDHFDPVKRRRRPREWHSRHARGCTRRWGSSTGQFCGTAA